MEKEINGFTVRELLPEVYQIQDRYHACASLIIGREKAVLFDTMNGIGDLKGLVEGLASTPLIVMNSHGHADHMGGNYQFEQVFLNRRDWGVVKANRAILDTIAVHMNENLSNCRKSMEMLDRLRDIAPGTRIDLGGRSVRILALEGHTEGSIGLLLEEERVLFAGDAFTPQMCLFFPESLSVEAYQNMILRTKEEPFEQYVLGHYTQLFPKSYLEKMLACSRLAEQGAKSYSYEYSLVPEYKGKLYIYDTQDSQIEDMVCIITK